MNLSPADAEWFDRNPDRQYCCRHQTDEEKGADRAALSGPAYGLVIVWRSDGKQAEMWSSNPDLYIERSDESLWFWFDHYRESAA